MAIRVPVLLLAQEEDVDMDDLLAGAESAGRVRLDPLRVSDAAEMAAVLSAPQLYTVIGGDPPSVAELTDLYRGQVVGRSADGREQWLNWVVRVGSQAVGYVQATVTGTDAEVAWVIGLPWQGRGYATEATRAMLDLLAAAGVRTVAAYVHPEHAASAAVARAAGLHPTGELDADGEQRWVRSGR